MNLLEGENVKISNVIVSDVTATSATISWETDQPAETFLAWGRDGGLRGTVPTPSPTGSTILGTKLSTSHTVTLTHLWPLHYGYFFIIRARSANGTDFYDSTQQGEYITTLAAPVDGPIDAYLQLNGPSSVVQGYSQVWGVQFGQISGANIQQNATISLDGLPPFTDAYWPDCEWNGLQQCIAVTRRSMTQWGISQPTQFMLRTNQGGVTPTGFYTVTVTLSVPGIQFVKSVQLKLAVQPVVAWTPQPVSATPPPVPCLVQWEQWMVKYGQQWGGKATDYDQSVGYYDAEWVYRQIKQYDQAHGLTGNPAQWDAFIAQAHKVYATRVQTQPIPGYWVFPHGLALGGDTEDLHLLATDKAVNHNLWAGSDIPFDLGAMREMSYQLNAFRLDQDTGHDHHQQIEQLVDYLLGYIDRIVHNHPDSWVFESFMGGLMARALIEYYEDGNHHDIRIPVALKQLADWMWAQMWNTWVEDRAFVFQWGQFNIGLQMAIPGPYFMELKGLNLLIAPLYAWLYKTGAGSLYQWHGDTIFAGAFTANPGDTVGWPQGKDFSQQYTWSFKYVEWRDARHTSAGGKLYGADAITK